VLKNYVRYIYKCEKCGTEESKKENPTIIKTKTPNAILTHSFVSPSLATEVIYQKYYMGTPLYRQEKMWDDLGLVLPRNMMANWCIKISQYYLEPLYKLMLDKIKENSRLIHCNETTIQVNKEENFMIAYH
jgi:transposase IS66